MFNISDISSMFANQISVDKLCQIYGLSANEKIIVPDIKYFKQMATYLKNENLPILKNYIKSVIYADYATFADEQSVDAHETYRMEAYGMKEKADKENMVLEKIQSLLGYQCGRVFCEKYFQESTKTDVKKLVDEVIQVYHKRIAKLEWMSEETKQMAREKLNKIAIKIGYPDNWPQEKYDMILIPPQDDGLYINNQFIIKQVQTDYIFSTKDEPVDRTNWVDYPQIVNAYYMSTNNTIYLLAGILQSPFYNPQVSKEENLGGIGFIIAHEITHAFDNNGAKFDANGNLNNWWTEEDFEKFNSLSKKVVEYYNGYDINGKQINGTQTLSENIADLGAISCITEIANNNRYDLKKVYKAYASMWASKSREEYEDSCIAQDVHSPAKVRTNAVLSAIDGFYSAYNIRENDQMYKNPEDRPLIW
ncbi:MAG: M13 family metallopeptidase [Oscillospiraceae bacterium]|nr:M13 family metallopeptidase [Oscillospiraceae bacterium]